MLDNFKKIKLAATLGVGSRDKTSSNRSVTARPAPAISTRTAQYADYREDWNMPSHSQVGVDAAGIRLDLLDPAVAQRFSGFIAIGSAHVAPRHALFPVPENS
jgi:hypothetical protein